MDERVTELYRAHGAAIFSRCLRLLGDADAAAFATARVFTESDGRAGDPAVLDRLTREVCGRHRRLLLVPAEPHPTEAELAAARERFDRDVFARTLPLVLRDQKPPPLLRWLFIYAPILVGCAAVGMIFAARNPMNPERFGGGRRDAGLQAFIDRGGGTSPLRTGMTVHPGEHVSLVVAPAGHRYVTVLRGARVIARLGPLERDTPPMPVATPVIVEDEGRLRLTAHFGASPKGLPTVEVALEMPVAATPVGDERSPP